MKFARGIENSSPRAFTINVEAERMAVPLIKPFFLPSAIFPLLPLPRLLCPNLLWLWPVFLLLYQILGGNARGAGD